MQDSKGQELHVGDRVLYATWGMFDVHKAHWANIKRYVDRRLGDPEYITG